MAPIWKKQLKVKKAFYFYILFSNVDETNGFETQIVGTRRKVSTRVQDVPIKDTRTVTRPRTRRLHTRWVGGGDTGGLTGARSAGVEIPREPRGKATAEDNEHLRSFIKERNWPSRSNMIGYSEYCEHLTNQLLYFSSNCSVVWLWDLGICLLFLLSIIDKDLDLMARKR